MISYDIPDLSHLTSGFPDYWLRVIFLGDKPADYSAHAQMHTIVRLTEVSVRQYEAARLSTHALWDDASGINVGAMNDACASLEACITNMHKVIAAVKALRKNSALPSDLRKNFPKHLGFLRAEKPIRIMRDGIQHTLDKILAGEIPADAPFMLWIDGPHNIKEGEFHKSIDRALLGKLEIKFADVAKWLIQMTDCAKVVAEFSPRGVSPRGPVAG